MILSAKEVLELKRLEQNDVDTLQYLLGGLIESAERTLALPLPSHARNCPGTYKPHDCTCGAGAVHLAHMHLRLQVMKCGDHLPRHRKKAWKRLGFPDL